MVNDEGQLYTIEGIAAAILLLVTIYIVLGTTIIYTPGETHISDMQLEQLGNDALAMMDTPTQYVETPLPDPNLAGSSVTTYTAKQSDLENYILNSDSGSFGTKLSAYLNTKNTSPDDHLQYSAIVWYRNEATNSIGSYPFATSGALMTGREHFVRVTRLVTLPNPPNPAMDTRPQTVLMDVMIWRD